MKKLFFVFVLFATFCFNCGITYAECSNEKIAELKEKSKNIEIKYELQENVEGEYGYENGTFDIIIANLPDELSVRDDYYNYSFNLFDKNDEGIIRVKSYLSGKHEFEVLSNECDEVIRTITVEVPRYNPYSEDPLCEGISEDQLDVCGTWYKYELDYETFKNKVENYKKSNNNNEDEVKSNAFESMLKFLIDNIIYIIISLLIVLTVVVVIIIRRKRSALE